MLDKTVELFIKGGPIMWPILLLSLIATTVVIERLIFLAAEKKRCSTETRREIIRLTEKGKIDTAISKGIDSKDFVSRTLSYALQNREEGLTEALVRASNTELLRFKRGLSILDTAITLAPLLGLLGTVTGMISAFGMVTGELGAPTAISGGIAEALIATASGLGVAILALIPFNALNAKYEMAQHDLEDMGTQLELILARQTRQQ